VDVGVLVAILGDVRAAEIVEVQADGEGNGETVEEGGGALHRRGG